MLDRFRPSHDAILSEVADARKFIADVPPGTWVWRDSERGAFGQTVLEIRLNERTGPLGKMIADEGVYRNPKSDKVLVMNIRKNGSQRDAWDFRGVVQMSLEEKDWYSIV